MYKNDYNFPDFMNSASFWTKSIPDANDRIISLEAIQNFNLLMRSKISSLGFIDSCEKTIEKEKILEYITSYGLPSKDMYDSNGKLIDKSFYDKLVYNTNLDDIKDMVPLKFGMSIQKISIRSFPDENAVFSSIEHSKLNNFDRFQETGCGPCEPLLILHESRDKKWYFVKCYNYIGWTKASGIALAKDIEQIFDYMGQRNFLIVTGKNVTLDIDEASSSSITIICGMGTRLCLENTGNCVYEKMYTVKYPTRDADGMLSFKRAFIAKDKDVSEGYLPYSRYNIINQALKLLDTPYDWGDKFLGKDCSSFIMTIFRCFGFLLPRNADEQEHSFSSPENSITFFKNDTLEDRHTKLDKLQPGTALFRDGHVMMYLGKHENTHYMIHNFSQYGYKKENFFEARYALCVAISPVDLPSTDGTPYAEKFTSAVDFK